VVRIIICWGSLKKISFKNGSSNYQLYTVNRDKLPGVTFEYEKCNCKLNFEIALNPDNE